MVSTVDLCTLVERLANCTASETHTFSVTAKVLPGTPPAAPRHAVLHVEAVRRAGCGHSVARIRITAPIRELARIPLLITKALDESRLTPTPSITPHPSEHHK